MIRMNPLLVEAVRGISLGGTASASYMNLLLLQAGVLVLWWPKLRLVDALEANDGPMTLAAIVIAVGLCLAFQAARQGMEEVTGEEAATVHEWVHGTTLPIHRVVQGLLMAKCVQTLHNFVLSAPLIACALALAGTPWIPIVWCAGLVVAQAVTWGLVSTAVYWHVGHNQLLTYLTARLGLATVYALTAVFVPALSAVRVPYDILDIGVEPLEPALVFIAAHALLGIGACVVLISAFRRARQSEER